MLGVSSPTKCGVAGDPLGSEFASVIYGFVLLLGIPTLVCVLPAPGRLRGPTPVLSTWLGNPSAAVLSWEVPCSVPADTSPPSSYPEQGNEGCCSSLSGKALPSLAWQGSLVALSFLLVLSNSSLHSSPENGLSPWHILSRRGRSLCSTPVWNGESRRCGHGRPWEAEPPAGAVGGPRSAAVRPFPDKWGLGHTDRGIFVFLLLCH